MTSFYPADDDLSRLRWSIVDALRRYGPDATKIGHLFASQHRLQFTDLQALVAIMGSEGAGSPLTPGRLKNHLDLSSAGTSYVIDRLVEAGHVRRVRDHPTDNRIVHLRYTESGQATALAFFGPLGDRTETIMDTFSRADLEVIARFMSAVSEMMHDYLAELEAVAHPDPD